MDSKDDYSLDKDAEEKCKAVGEAYFILCDSGKPRIYDRIESLYLY